MTTVDAAAASVAEALLSKQQTTIRGGDVGPGRCRQRKRRSGCGWGWGWGWGARTESLPLCMHSAATDQLKRHRPRVRQPWAAMSCTQCGACAAWLGPQRARAHAQSTAVTRGAAAHIAWHAAAFHHKAETVHVERGRWRRRSCAAGNGGHPRRLSGLTGPTSRRVWARPRRVSDSGARRLRVQQAPFSLPQQLRWTHCSWQWVQLYSVLGGCPENSELQLTPGRTTL